MKWTTLAAGMVAIAPIVFPMQASAKDDVKRDVTLRGCVISGESKGTYAMAHVTEMPATGDFATPDWAHGRRVVFWLKGVKDKDLKASLGHMVEVNGRLDSFKDSEIELKARNGELYFEFEGPGKDVKVPASLETLSQAIGTSGTVQPGQHDIKTMLGIVNVKNVKGMSDTCGS